MEGEEEEGDGVRPRFSLLPLFHPHENKVSHVVGWQWQFRNRGRGRK